jgi:hypothetical protein
MADDLLGPPVEYQQGLTSIDYFITNDIKCPIMSQGRCRYQAAIPRTWSVRLGRDAAAQPRKEVS